MLRPVEIERTALGAAHAAGAAVGLWELDDIASRWAIDRVFEPTLSAEQREERYAGWQAAVRTVTGQAS